jgi:hypothetical protein
MLAVVVVAVLEVIGLAQELPVAVQALKVR